VDVVLLDLHLRQGTGFGVLRSIPADQAKKVVVIVLTNYDLAEYRRAAAALGATHFPRQVARLRSPAVSAAADR
jgi:CheY-like chemotaxis protein